MGSMREDKPFLIRTHKEPLEKLEKWVDILGIHKLTRGKCKEKEYKNQLFEFRIMEKDIKKEEN